ncbi:MAG: hypothetical protein ABIY50_02655 [Ignavibacteria bacterium]
MIKKPKNEKTIEQTDYKLKAEKKFPPDKEFPLNEQSKQKKEINPVNKEKVAHKKKPNDKRKKIEQNPGAVSGKKQKRIY